MIGAVEAAQELLDRRRARERLIDFTTYTKPDYEVGWHHEVLGDFLDRFARREVRRGMIFMPPQHGKSELVSRRLPARLFGEQPGAKVIAASYAATLASAMNRDVKKIMDGARYRRLYPNTRLGGKNVRALEGTQPLRNSDEFEILDGDGNFTGGHYRCAGVGGGITGKPMDYGLIDDPIKGREQADSPAWREMVWGWYNGDFLSRCHGETSILICSTRWNLDDLPGRLLKQMVEDPKADQWEVLCLPAICENPAPYDRRQVGEALWPSRHPLASLEAKRAASLYDWDSLYQQRPRSAGSVEWPDTYFDGPGFWFEDWPANNELELRVVTLDPSKGADAKSADFQALIKYGRDKNGVEYVECDMGKRPMVAPRTADGQQLGEGMVETAVDWINHFKPHGFGLETNQFQVLLKIPLLAELDRRRVEVQIFELNNVDSKPLRIRRLSAPLSRRKIRFRKTRGTRLLVEQLKLFPTADHDDGPDALEMARRVAVTLFNER